MNRPEIMEKVVPYYSHAWSKYPDQIRMSFEDGKSVIYEARMEQPAPVIIENIKIIRKWKQGYVNQPERRKRRK